MAGDDELFGEGMQMKEREYGCFMSNEAMEVNKRKVLFGRKRAVPASLLQFVE
jgi:hypothetical protein